MNDPHLLSSVSRNAAMGTQGIRHLFSSVKDADFRTLLRRQYRDYRCAEKKADELLRTTGKKPKPLGIGARIGSRLSNAVNTLTDSSTPHLAEMMIEGTSIGVAKLTRDRNEARRQGNVSESVLSLASDLIDTEEKNIEALKKFL